MARSMSDCVSQISAEESADTLYNFLKTSASTTLENNEMKPNPQPDAYANPPLRAERDETSEALWGQEPREARTDSRTEDQHSNAVWDGFRAGREKFLKRHFEAFTPSRDQATGELDELLTHFKDGDHESHAAFTREHSKRNPAVVATVFDKTKKLLDW